MRIFTSFKYQLLTSYLLFVLHNKSFISAVVEFFIQEDSSYCSLRYKDADAWPIIGANSRRAHGPTYGKPTLSQPAFYWKVPDKYIEQLNFGMAVINIM